MFTNEFITFCSVIGLLVVRKCYSVVYFLLSFVSSAEQSFNCETLGDRRMEQTSNYFVYLCLVSHFLVLLCLVLLCLVSHCLVSLCLVLLCLVLLCLVLLCLVLLCLALLCLVLLCLVLLCLVSQCLVLLCLALLCLVWTSRAPRWLPRVSLFTLSKFVFFSRYQT